MKINQTLNKIIFRVQINSEGTFKLYCKSKKKKTIYFNANYRTEMKLKPTIMVFFSLML